jgi:serine/threonine protein kinase
MQRVGQWCGNYQLHLLLGQGSFAEVYLGFHRYLHTPAAIKLLRQSLHHQAQQAFLQEAQIIACLIHPHIVRVLDFGIEGQTPFLVLDYAPAGSLRQRYPSGCRVPLLEVVPIVEQVAQALHYAHCAGRIHQDVKPENLLVGRQQTIWLSDFGLAISIPSAHALASAEAVGTPAYAAPEQLRGQSVPASDQYALGVIVYEWLSGHLPFVGSAEVLASQHLLTPPPPLRQHLPALPRAVEEVVLTALAKDPRARFPSVEAFAGALRQASQPAPSWFPAVRVTPTRSDSASAAPAPLPAWPVPKRVRLLPAAPTISARPLTSVENTVSSRPPRWSRQRPRRSRRAPRVWRNRPVEARGGHKVLVAHQHRPVAHRARSRMTSALERLAMVLLLLVVLSAGVAVPSLAWVQSEANSTPGSSIKMNLATLPLAPTFTAPSTVSFPVSPSATPTPTPDPTLQFGVTPLSFVDHCGSSKTILSPKTLLLDNSGSTVPVDWQVQITDTDHGNAPWATASPTSGRVPAGQERTFLLVPARQLCQHAKNPVTYHVVLIYQGAGTSGSISVTDLVVVP